MRTSGSHLMPDGTSSSSQGYEEAAVNEGDVSVAVVLGGGDTASEESSVPEFETSEKKQKRSSVMKKVTSVAKLGSLMKAITFYDIEANFHGDKQMLFDPDVKFSKLGESFWRLDFKPSSLKRRGVYTDNIKFLLGLGVEVLLVGGFGLLYTWGLSSIPYTKNSQFYYDPMMIATYYFVTLSTLFIVIGYGFFVMIYGFKVSLPLVWWTLIPGSIISVLPFIFLAAGIELWFYSLDLVLYLIIGALFMNTGRVIAKAVIGNGDKQHIKDLILAYSTPLSLHALIIGLYAFVIIPYYRILTNDVVRAVFRMVIHPIVCQINLSIASKFCKMYPRVQHQHLTTGVVFGIYVENAMFGRFLIATVGSLTSQLATSAAAGVAEIITRVLVLKREHIFHYFLKKVVGVEKLTYNEAKERAFMGQFNNNAMVVEHVSILVVPFLLHSFYKHRFAFNFSYTSEKLDVEVLYRSAAVQMVIQLFVHFVCCILEYLMKIPNILVWKQERKIYMLWEIANFIQIITLIVYVFKTLPSAWFCHNTNPCSCRDSSYLDLSLFYATGYCDNYTP